MIAWHAHQNASLAVRPSRGHQAHTHAGRCRTTWCLSASGLDEHILGGYRNGPGSTRPVKGHEPSVGRDRWVVAGVSPLGSGRVDADPPGLARRPVKMQHILDGVRVGVDQVGRGRGEGRDPSATDGLSLALLLGSGVTLIPPVALDQVVHEHIRDVVGVVADQVRLVADRRPRIARG